MKMGCLCFFNAKWPYMNNNMCVIKYHNMTHNNVVKHAWHGIAMELSSFIEY
jgi:hypothetical protein